MRKQQSPKTAKIYQLDPENNYACAIENRMYALCEKAADGKIHGMTYITTDKNGDFQVGRVGLHRQNKAISIGALFQAAVALVLHDEQAR